MTKSEAEQAQDSVDYKHITRKQRKQEYLREVEVRRSEGLEREYQRKLKLVLPTITATPSSSLYRSPLPPPAPLVSSDNLCDLDTKT